MAVIDGVVIKGRHIVIPEALQQQALKQLHINHMGIKKQTLGSNKVVFSLEQNSGCICRQAFIHYCGLHQA